MERNAEAEKAGPENFLAQPPWGWKEASNEDGRGIGGKQTRLFAFQAELA
jgi:hypothetical protein